MQWGARLFKDSLELGVEVVFLSRDSKWTIWQVRQTYTPPPNLMV